MSLQRIDNVNSKIEALKSAKKATVVFSSARYPSGEDGAYQDMFTRLTMSSSQEKHRITEKIQEFNMKNLQNKLQLYSFKCQEGEEEERVGLGSIPTGLRSVSSLTVYNTALCPYTDYAILNTGTSRGKKAEAAQSASVDIEETSALQEDSQDRTGQADLLYFPEMGDLPDFDLPDDLELPNIATDLQVGHE